MKAGQVIAGKYRLNRLLGSGGMASVWSATNVFTEREFAVKFMHPHVARTPESAHRFLLEAKVSARIDHPNIIDVIDVGQAEDGALFLVMELLSGMSLDGAIRRQKPPLLIYEYVLLMQEVAQALAAAHRSGVIHRDLKPSNVFLHKDRDGRVVPKILDFGVSKILEEENSTALTVVGTVLGSPQYMSPEQAMGEVGIDGRTDVFAFGSMMFEALVGQRAYDGINFNALIVAIATKQPKSIDDLAPHVPASLRAIVRDCMVTDKAKRLASFDRVAERLDGVLPELLKSELRITPRPRAELPAASSPPSRPPPSSRSPQAIDHPRQPSPERPISIPPATPPALPPRASAAEASATPAARAWSRATKRIPPGWMSHPMALFAGGGGALLIAALVGGGVVLLARGRAAPSAAAGSLPATAPQPTTPSAVPRPSAPAGTAESSDVPGISVDSLPVATRGAPLGKGNGRLVVVAGPGWCSVSVDGAAHGVTPVPAFELTAGPHRIDCVAPSGKSRSASVTIAEGTGTRYKFSLDE